MQFGAGNLFDGLYVSADTHLARRDRSLFEMNNFLKEGDCAALFDGCSLGALIGSPQSARTAVRSAAFKVMSGSIGTAGWAASTGRSVPNPLSQLGDARIGKAGRSVGPV